MSTPEFPNDTKTSAKSLLELDPGLGSSPRRKPSGCRFICKSILWVFAGLFGVFVAIILFRSGASFVNGTLRFTHASVYQNQTWEEAVKTGLRYTVARPLIDQEQKFDVGVTVWLRKTEEEMGAVGGDATEQAIYQDIVFRGLKLREKARLAKIPLQIPPAVFRSENITTSDLSASIVLIPQSPSLLDRMTNYSSWGPTPMKPVRNETGYSLDPEALSPSLRDRAIDSFAIRLDLIRLYENKTMAMEGYVYEDDDDEPLFGIKDVPDGNEAVCYALADSGQVILAKPGHKLQPLIISKLQRSVPLVHRSHVLVADETHVFSLKSLMDKHRKLLIYGRLCNQRPGICVRSRRYQTHGHWETLIQLGPDSNEDSETINTKSLEWTYPPYLTGTRRASGPKDLIPVPVTRQICDRNVSNATSHLLADRDKETPVNVTWHLTFSVVSPGKIATVEMFNSDSNSSSVKNAGPHDSEEEQAAEVMELSLMNAFMGNSPHGHPRRKYVVDFIRIILCTLYWIRRARGPTVHLSIKGTYLIVLSYILSVVLGHFEENSWLFSALWILGFPVSMLRTVSPVKLVWSNTRWIPSAIEATKPNHQERASHRLDQRFKKRYALVIFTALTLLYHFLDPFSIYLIARIDPPKAEITHAWTWAWVFYSPLFITGHLCQIVLNYRSKVFAGDYKLSVYLWAMETVCDLASHLEWVMGNDRAGTGWTVGDAGLMLLVGVLVLQALSLRDESKPEAEDEHEK
ncbi:hypothetical protein VNI00_007045 [Paramarasmius palmivorus]|uniref:Uncharacterized protein n=1 Tax=Paramarasmius palmivorus TaxID=297713 RepID=A0AAW0D5G4_9AGAR